MSQKRSSKCFEWRATQHMCRANARISGHYSNHIHLLSFAFVCFHLRAPCFHHAPNLHLYSPFLRLGVPMTSLMYSLWRHQWIHITHTPNLKLGIVFIKTKRSNIDFRRALAFTLLAFAFNYGRLRTFLLARFGEILPFPYSFTRSRHASLVPSFTKYSQKKSNTEAIYPSSPSQLTL